MYVLDTNVFIDAANAYYAFDLAPGYWDFLVQLFDSHHAVSIKSVYDELGEAGDGDPLKDWARANKQHFVAPDSRVVACYQRVIAWAKNNYDSPAVIEFQRVADSWIVAHALANGWVVVTHEKSAPRSKRRIKIPDACAALGVECLNPFMMLRDMGMSLAL
ncbi:DUF4411 family protein [Pauljensenia sp. 27098_8_83]|jgi:hypothetical protein